MKQIIYVDSLYGDDFFSGDLSSPVRTLPYGVSQVYEGGTVVLQNGDGGSYGPVILTKNITLKAAYGSTPYVGTVTFHSAQGLVEGLYLDNLPNGIVVNNAGLGSVIARECHFTAVESAIHVVSAQYVSAHRNYFYNHKYGIRVSSAQEVCVSSNIFDRGARSIEINAVYRADVWNNTIYGASSISSGVIPDVNLRVLYVTLTSFNINNVMLQLPGFATLGPGGMYDVAVNIVNGPSFLYGTDYTVQSYGSTVSWSGLGLQNQLVVGDMLRIMYSESTDPGSGDAVRVLSAVDSNSRVDSNNITARIGVSDIALGVFFSSPVKIRHNNFYRNTAWWSGATPTGDTGLQNINDNPLYIDPEAGDFHLQHQGVSGTSPDIDAADPGKWDNILNEMGLWKNYGFYTATYTGAVRQNVAPFDRAYDYDSYDRSVTGMAGTTGDIGALEFNQHETAMGNYVSERGYDIANPGTATGPYATLDRGYARADSLSLYVDTHLIPCQVGVTGGYTGISHGTGYGRYHSKNIVLSDSDLKVGRSTSGDIAYVYSSYPAYETGAVYVGPDYGVGDTGTPGNPFRTITEALASGSLQVFVKPGFYSTFKGVTGVHLAGVEDIRSVGIGKELYSSLNTGWTGAGSYVARKSSIEFGGVTGLLSMFTLGETGSVDIDFKYTAVAIERYLYGGLTNGLTGSRDTVYAVLDSFNQSTVIGYSISGMAYEIPAAYTGVFSDIKVRIRLVDGKFIVTINGADLSRSYGGDFAVTGLWRAEFIPQGTTGTVSDLYLYTDVFRGATGSVSSFGTRRKVFGILGSTGMAA